MVAWDEPKRRANLTKHGLDIAAFEDCFSFDRFKAYAAKPSLAGRLRYTLVGLWNGDLVVAAIVSPLGSEAVSLVSLRPASKPERKAYGQT